MNASNYIENEMLNKLKLIDVSNEVYSYGKDFFVFFFKICTRPERFYIKHIFKSKKFINESIRITQWVLKYLNYLSFNDIIKDYYDEKSLCMVRCGINFWFFYSKRYLNDFYNDKLINNLSNLDSFIIKNKYITESDSYMEKNYNKPTKYWWLDKWQKERKVQINFLKRKQLDYDSDEDDNSKRICLKKLSNIKI